MTHNGTELQAMTYNGQEVNSWVHNGVEVFSVLPIDVYFASLIPAKFEGEDELYGFSVSQNVYNEEYLKSVAEIVKIDCSSSITSATGSRAICEFTEKALKRYKYAVVTWRGLYQTVYGADFHYWCNDDSVDFSQETSSATYGDVFTHTTVIPTSNVGRIGTQISDVYMFTAYASVGIQKITLTNEEPTE